MSIRVPGRCLESLRGSHIGRGQYERKFTLRAFCQMPPTERSRLDRFIKIVSAKAKRAAAETTSTKMVVFIITECAAMDATT